jgi:transposase InsO family protein
MRALGLAAPRAARIAGVHEATLRRWRARTRRGEPLATRRASPHELAPELVRSAAAIVRKLHGLVGAESLRRSVCGLSRREAACVKAQTLCAMERERKASLTRVTVSVPGVMRGLDGMYLHGADASVHALFTADAAVPYRTSVTTGAHYDSSLVVRAMSSDIERNGAPLVYRMDRASAHDAPAVRELLEAHGVLVLHGPPRCPRFYGQHERLNREHRAWADELAQLGAEDIQARLEEILLNINSVWRRRTLRWQTASEAWATRPRLHVDRAALREEVRERAARIGRELQHRGRPADLAERLAIEQALETRGYLRQQLGGWC